MPSCSVLQYSFSFHTAFVEARGLGGNVCVVFLPAEPRLTLRKVSRDPFSMNSVMIITGLPTEAHNKAAVIGAELQGGETPTIKRRGRRRSWVHSCDLPPSPSLCLSPGDNMACRHQSHWQLLIRPLHKRQEIIRMDQSSRMCVCVCVSPEISWILISLKGRGLWLNRYMHLHECVFVWWRGGWLTGPAHYGPLHGIWWGLQMMNKVPAITCTQAHTRSPKNSGCPCSTRLSLLQASSVPHKQTCNVQYTWRCVCVHGS